MTTNGLQPLKPQIVAGYSGTVPKGIVEGIAVPGEPAVVGIERLKKLLSVAKGNPK